MKFNNPLNMAHALAAQRSLASVESQKASGHLSTEAMQDKLNLAGDPGQSRLGFFNSLRARRHEAQESLETSNTVISYREAQMRSLATEAIAAQITLMRADLKQRFDCEFAVIAERGLAAHKVPRSGDRQGARGSAPARPFHPCGGLWPLLRAADCRSGALDAGVSRPAGLGAAGNPRPDDAWRLALIDPR